MRPARAFHLAERCFAVARSTAFPAERDAAIARGEAIAKGAGLSLDRFDVPGRTPTARPRVVAVDLQAGRIDELRDRMRAQHHDMVQRYGSAVATVLDQLWSTLDARSAETAAAENETVYDARRRNFDAAVAAAKARDAARQSRP